MGVPFVKIMGVPFVDFCVPRIIITFPLDFK